jgi:probable F420-dependent oxidoreductase
VKEPAPETIAPNEEPDFVTRSVPQSLRKVRMQIGIQLPQLGAAASRQAITTAAVRAEEIGLDSVWVCDRLLRTTRPIPFRGQPPGPMPRDYAIAFDPVETLVYVAAITDRVQLGTSALLALFQSPVLLARRLATLDQLSGGRVIAGLAAGWLEEEFSASGLSMARRGRRMTEFVAALRAAWGHDPVRFEGEFYSIPESDIGPKPVQPDGIPVLLAYRSDAALERAARIADGLNPFATMDLERLERDVMLFRKTAQAAGRNADVLPVVVRANARVTEAPLPEKARSLFAGTLEQWLADLERVRAIGVGHVIFGSDTPAPLDVQLEALAEIRRAVPSGSTGRTSAVDRELGGP